FPGNLYNYGSPLPPVIDENTLMRPSSRKGQLRVAIEDRMAEAAARGARIVILRAGDFYGGGRGSWLDPALPEEIGPRPLPLPGPAPLHPEEGDLPHAAAPLPRPPACRQARPPR